MKALLLLALLGAAAQAALPLRYVAASPLLLRAAPSSQGEVLARLTLNTALHSSGPAEGAFCPVQTTSEPALQGYVACRYLAETQVNLKALGEPWLNGEFGKPNPAYNPRRLFDMAPSWDRMARYEMQQLALCEGVTPCARQDADFADTLARMRKRLHGDLAPVHEDPTPLLRWSELDRDPASLPARLGIWNETSAPALALWKALPLPPVTPSWLRSEADIASSGASLAVLARQFGGQQRWFVAALMHDQVGERNRDARIERLTQPLQRIELRSDGSLRGQAHTPQRVNREWKPDIDYMCANWDGPGFELGDTDNATWKRNREAFGDRPALIGPYRLFTLYSSRPLPEGARQVHQQTQTLDPARTGFTQLETRLYDLDADGVPDLLWAQGTGQGPGHIDGPPPHHDPWWRLLLVNVQGEWRLLATDQISYGCGC